MTCLRRLSMADPKAPPLTSSYCLAIAGVSFYVDIPADLPISDPPFYFPFIDRDTRVDPSSCDYRVRVRYECGEGLAESGVRVFDARPCWEMFEIQGGGRRIIRRPDSGQKGLAPLWVADVSANGADVDVWVTEDVDPMRYPLDQILVVQHLAARGGVLLHAACVVHDGLATVMPGVSGAGKSTICRSLVGDSAMTVMSDDRVVLRVEGDRVMAYGTPWPGEGGFATVGGVPVDQILFLEQADSLGVVPLQGVDMLARLAPVASIPWYDRERMSDCLATCADVLERVPAGLLNFPRADDLGDLFRERVLRSAAQRPC